MRYLKQSVLAILGGSVILYLVASFFPGLGFVVISDYSNVWFVFLFFGIVSWIFNVVVKGILRLLTLPLSVVSLGLISFVINFLLLYVFEQFVNFLAVGVIVHLGTVIQVFVLSCVLSSMYLLLRKIK